MATELATAYLSLIPTLKGAGKRIQSELDGVNIDPSGKKMGKQLGDGLTEGAKSGSGGIMSAIGGIAKVAGPALAAIGFSQLVGEAAAATDATQKFKSTLEFAGKADEVERLTASTRKYADETVYDLSDIQNITAQLAANSVKDYDKLAEAAGNLNAVAGGNAETFSSVGMVLTQTAGAGKLTTENWNQLADAIPGASDKLQKAMLKNGAYTGNFREAMEKGEISAEEFNQAILDLGFDEAAVKAAKSTATFEGAFGNLRAAAVGGISDVMAKLQPTITGVVNGLVPVVEGAFGTIVTGAGFVADNIGLIAPAVAAVTAAFAAFKAANFASTLMAQFGSLSNVMSIVKTSASGLFATLAANPIALVVAAIAALCAGLVVAFNTNEQFRATVLAAWDGIKAAAAEVWPAIQQAVTSACEAMGNVVNAVWPVIQGVITTAMNVVKAVIVTVLALISGDWDGAWSGIKALTAAVFSGIGNIVDVGISTVQSLISGALDVIDWLWRGAWNALGGLLNAAWNDFISTVSGGNERVMGLLRDLPGKITGVFAGAGSWLINAGKSIINGLLDGLKRAWGNVTGFIGGIGDWIVSHKGPPSYDAVMLTKNGELIMRGLLDGLTTGWGDVEDFIGSRNADISARYAVSSAVSPAHAPAGVGATYNVYLDGRALHVDERVADAMERFVDVVVASYE